MRLITNFILSAGLLVIIVTSGCRPDSGLGGNAKIEGRALLQDPITSNRNPVSGANVYISFTQSNTISYDMTTVTDANGYYSFDHLLGANPSYSLWCLYETNTTKYQSYTSVAVSDQVLYTQDLLLNSVNVNNDNAIYGRISLENILTGITQTQEGVNVQLTNDIDRSKTLSLTTTTDKEGYYRFANLPASTTYTVSGSYSLTSTTNTPITYVGSSTATVVSQSATLKNIDLIPKSVGDLLVFVNPNNATLPNYLVCVYANKNLSESSNGCVNSIYSGPTNTFSRVLFRNLNPGGTYYIKVSDPQSQTTTFATSTSATSTTTTSTSVTINSATAGPKSITLNF